MLLDITILVIIKGENERFTCIKTMTDDDDVDDEIFILKPVDESVLS